MTMTVAGAAMRTTLLPLLLLIAGAFAGADGIGRQACAAPSRGAAVFATNRLRQTPRPMLLAAAPASMPPLKPRSIAVGWGALGVVGILANAIGRLTPVALQPILNRDLTLLQWAMYGGSMLFFAYVEGYKAFQRKFSPLVVRRALTLSLPKTPWHHYVFAPFYSMGLFHASKKRRTISWSISLGVFTIIALVKRLPYPYRSIVDAGVVAGLSWGSASIVAIYVRAALGGKAIVAVDPEMPALKEE